jgi:RNA recognition motif-containing protein
VYLPTNFRNMTVFGYAIVNFSAPADAEAALEKFRGMDVDGQAMITEWSKSQQGYDDLVCRYRDSPVMHTSVPDKHKPIILAKGILQTFPPPTEPLQLPRKFAPTTERF